MNLQTYIDLINGLNNQVDNVKRSLLQGFNYKSVWVTGEVRMERTLAYLYDQGNDNYELAIDDGPVLTCLADIKRLLVHDHRLVIVL